MSTNMDQRIVNTDLRNDHADDVDKKNKAVQSLGRMSTVQEVQTSAEEANMLSILKRRHQKPLRKVP